MRHELLGPNSMITRIELQVADTQIVSLPATGKILSMQVARNAPSLFVRVFAKEIGTIMEDHVIAMHMTGHSHREIKGTYLGTFQVNNGEMSLHVFDEGKPQEKIV